MTQYIPRGRRMGKLLCRMFGHKPRLVHENQHFREWRCDRCDRHTQTSTHTLLATPETSLNKRKDRT